MIKDLLIVTIFPGLMALAAATDLVTMTLPNRLVLALAAGFFLVARGTDAPYAAEPDAWSNPTPSTTSPIARLSPPT